MDLVQNFMNKESGSVISELPRQGFSAGQANGFLPEALATPLQGLKDADFTDLFCSASSGGHLASSVEIAALGLRSGIDSSNAEAGLNALIPRLPSQRITRALCQVSWEIPIDFSAMRPVNAAVWKTSPRVFLHARSGQSS